MKSDAVSRATTLRGLVVGLLLALMPAAARAQTPPRAAHQSLAYVDSAGVMRWRATGKEVTLFGANYTLPSASDYRAPGYLELDRKKLVDEDMAHFARMGWDGLRISFWGDWENSDHAGNLIANAHLDLMDYVIAKAHERGIYVLLSPITTYQSTWPDALSDTTPPGFANFFKKSELGTNPAAIAAQANYLRQLLRHVNPYTHASIADDPMILFVEMINEPTHHSEDIPGSIRYIDALVDATRAAGSSAILFHNLTQDVRIAAAIAKSKAQGVTFGWYPSGLNSGHELRGNYLRAVDDYGPMRSPLVAHLPRIVYEFDTPDLRTGYMYPAMARTYRSVGAQFAAMFAYDMLGTASRNLGWQTHYLNLVYTPRKAMSAIIAAEAMRRLPRMQQYGAYPANTQFGDFRVDYERNSSELDADDAYLYAGSTRSVPRHPERLTRVAGYGSSPIVEYAGEGIYFLDRIREGVWRLEVYPDAVPVADPYELPRADKIVTRAIRRAWPMTIRLPGLGTSFFADSLAGGARAAQASGGTLTVVPGVYVLSLKGDVGRYELPMTVGQVNVDEYYAPPDDPAPLSVERIAPSQFVLGQPVEIRARVVDSMPPDSVTLVVRSGPRGWWRRVGMHAAGGYEYAATIPSDSLGAGPLDYSVVVVRQGVATTFPERVHARPWEWNYTARDVWSATIVPPSTPLRLFDAAEDVRDLTFSRIGDGYRNGLFRVVVSAESGKEAMHFERPRVREGSPDDYTASLVIVDRIAARRADIGRATAVRLRVRALGAGQTVHVTLMEADGTSWSAAVRADTTWSDVIVPLRDFKPARGVLLPEGFPGEWNYWVGPAERRGGSGDSIRLPDVERFQLSLRKADASAAASGAYGIEIESATLAFR